MTIASIVIAFEAEQNMFALPLGGLEIGGPNGVDAVPGPDQIAIVAKDVWARLTRPMLLSRSIGVPRERRYEKIAFLDVAGGRNGDVEARRR